MPTAEKAVTIEDLRQMALRHLPDFVISYVERGAGDGGGVQRNVNAFRKFRFSTRTLLDVTPIDTSVELFGRSFSLPFGISAVGTAGIYRRHADEMLAEAARDANVPFILSGNASASLETIVKIAPDHTWFQMYGSKSEAIDSDIIARARGAGIPVLVFTVDFPVQPKSEISARTGISLATGPTLGAFPRLFWDAMRRPRWAAEFLFGGGVPRLESWAKYAPAGSNASAIAKYHGSNWLRNQTWRDVERMRSAWQGKLVVKGLVHPEDIRMAFEMGADVVTVSNHGGNKLDSMPASIDALRSVQEMKINEKPLFFDGGIRRGSDIAAALALGADYCFVGRPTLYGVAAYGTAGARRALAILKSDLEYNMAMIGCRTVRDLKGFEVTVER